MPERLWKKFLTVVLPLLCLSFAIVYLWDLPQRIKRNGPAFNIDFGVWLPNLSQKTGPAAAGREGDYWNTVAIAWNDDHTESGLKTARGEESPIRVRMINLSGGWGSGGKMGVADPMMDNFNYPSNNKGGGSEVDLYDVPAGVYDLYVYGHGASPLYYGDYALVVGPRYYGRKTTSKEMDAIQNTSWVEGSQYVKFSRVKVENGQAMEIIIRPGGTVSDGGRSFADAMICGLQLIPS